MMNRKFINMIKMFISLLLVVVISFSNSNFTSHASKSSGTFKDLDRSHWAYDAVYKSVQDGLVQGYEDQTFRPQQNVSAVEFVIMFYRVYQNEFHLDQTNSTNWKQSYERLAKDKKWKINTEKATISRGEIAQFIYSVFEGKHASAQEAIKYMLHQQYSNGLTSATVAGYGASTLLNRAQAVSFIQNIKYKVPKLSEYVALNEAQLASISEAEPILYADIQLREVQLGESRESLVAKLGEPDRKFTVNNVSYLTYNADYKQYALYIVANDIIHGMYSNANDVWKAGNMKLIGEVASQPLKETIGNAQVTYYKDEHANNKIEGIFVVTSNNYTPEYAKTELEGIEVANQNFDMTNAFRVKSNLVPFKWHEKLANTAFKYSKYMYMNNHFDHTDLHGLTAFDRIERDGIDDYRIAAENIAYRYSNAIEVTNAWINSLGHRKNILETRFQYVGIGVYQYYYTQIFVGF